MLLGNHATTAVGHTYEGVTAVWEERDSPVRIVELVAGNCLFHEVIDWTGSRRQSATPSQASDMVDRLGPDASAAEIARWMEEDFGEALAEGVKQATEDDEDDEQYR